MCAMSTNDVQHKRRKREEIPMNNNLSGRIALEPIITMINNLNKHRLNLFDFLHLSFFQK